MSEAKPTTGKQQKGRGEEEGEKEEEEEEKEEQHQQPLTRQQEDRIGDRSMLIAPQMVPSFIVPSLDGGNIDDQQGHLQRHVRVSATTIMQRQQRDEEEVEQLRMELTGMKRDLVTARDDLNRAEDRIHRLSKALNDKDEAADALNRRVNALRQDLAAKEDEIDGLSRKLREHKRITSEFESEIERLRSALQAKDRKIVELQTQVNAQANTVASHERTITALQDSMAYLMGKDAVVIVREAASTLFDTLVQRAAHKWTMTGKQPAIPEGHLRNWGEWCRLKGPNGDWKNEAAAVSEFDRLKTSICEADFGLTSAEQTMLANFKKTANNVVHSAPTAEEVRRMLRHLPPRHNAIAPLIERVLPHLNL